MQFLVKITLALFLFHSAITGLVVAQRVVRPTYLEQTLALSDECGSNCWFYVATDGTTQRQEVKTSLEKLDATYNRINRPRVNFGIEQGSGEFALEDGIVVSTCFFPRATTLGDVVVTFGEPDGFWVEYQGVRYSAKYNGLVFLKYEMIYRAEAIRLEGYIRLDTNAQRPRLSPQTTVDTLCTPLHTTASDDTPSARQWTEWQGFNAPLETFR